MVKSAWQIVKFVLVDWTVTPKMLALNERRPLLYQLITTPVITLVFGLLVAAGIIGLQLIGVWPSR